MTRSKAATVEEYLAHLPPERRDVVEGMGKAAASRKRPARARGPAAPRR